MTLNFARRQVRANAAADEAKNALSAFELSELSTESRGLLRLVDERQFSWTTFLSRLERVLPAEVRLSRLQPRFEDAGKIEISIALVGRGPESVVRTLAALARSPYFAAIELKSETRPDSKQGVPEGYTFTVTTTYAPKGAP